MKKIIVLFATGAISLMLLAAASEKVYAGIIEEKHDVATKTEGWAGSWTRIGSTEHDSTEIVISDVTSEIFKFTLNTQSGIHMDEFEGTASINGNKALYEDEELDCTFTFILQENTISLKKSDDCIVCMGCQIEGEYRTDEIRSVPTLLELGVIKTKTQEEEFLKLVGEDSFLFQSAMQLIAEGEDLDQFGARVYSGFVRGMATIMEAIIMITAENKIWAAVLHNDTVYYYTNDPAYLRKLPMTIERWREDFPEAKIIYASAEKAKSQENNNDLPIQFLIVPLDENSGLAWMEERAIEEGIDLRVIGITALDENTAFLYGSLSIAAGTVRSILLRTSNGGKIWSETMSPKIGNDILEVQFDASGIGFALLIWSVESPGDITLFRSSDFGKSWKKVSDIPSKQFEIPLRMSFATKEIGEIYLLSLAEDEANVRIINTSDSGISWEEIGVISENEFYKRYPEKSEFQSACNDGSCWKYVENESDQSQIIIYRRIADEKKWKQVAALPFTYDYNKGQIFFQAEK